MTFTRVAGAVLGVLVVVFAAGWFGNMIGDAWGESVGGFVSYTIVILAALAVAIMAWVRVRRNRSGA